MKVIYNPLPPHQRLRRDEPLRSHPGAVGVQAIKPGNALPRGDTHGADEGTAVRGLLLVVRGGMANKAVHLREECLP